MFGSRNARLAIRLALVGTLAVTGLGLAGAGAGAASAAGAGPITCTSSAASHYQYIGPTVVWTIAGRGSCVGSGQGTYFVDYTGTGTSTGHGACSSDNPTVTDLDLKVAGTLTKTDTLQTKALLQSWTAPVTTFPVTTPFTVNQGGSPIGVGVAFTHIFFVCPPGGSDVATIVFDYLP